MDGRIDSVFERVFGALPAVVLAFIPFALDASESFRFEIPEVSAQPGDDVELTIRGDYTRSAQGFTVALTFPRSDLEIRSVSFEDTILEAIEADFLESRVEFDGERGILVIAVLVDAGPPFDGQLIPSIGQPLDFAYIRARVSEEAEEDIEIRLEDGLLAPPISNVYVVDHEAIPVDELGSTRVRLAGVERFLRGDANVDGIHDISDPLTLLNSLFGHRRPLPCATAADANDDEQINIADPIYLLVFLFADGSPPPPPQTTPGRDPTPGSLVCARALSQ